MRDDFLYALGMQFIFFLFHYYSIYIVQKNSLFICVTMSFNCYDLKRERKNSRNFCIILQMLCPQFLYPIIVIFTGVYYYFFLLLQCKVTIML
jgi:hypothetical protein